MARKPSTGARRPARAPSPRSTRSLAPRAAWLRVAVLFTAPFGLVCGGAASSIPGGAPPAEAPAELLVRSTPSAPGALVFPPEDEGAREPRPALDEYLRGNARQGVAVAYPSLDDSGAFAIVGKTVRIVFNQEMALPERTEGVQPAAPGTVKITPEVNGDAVWIDSRTLELTAAAQLEKGTSYTVEIPALESASGKALEGGWKASFTATPSVTIAGKELGYVPEPGKLRTIAAHPSWDATVGRSPEMSVLYDQPIDLPVARRLIALTGKDGKPVPFVVDRPRGKSFQGVKVDPRYVVLIRPAAPLRHGQGVTLDASDLVDGAPIVSRTATYTVADALEETSVGCGYDWDSTPCPFDKGRLLVGNREIHVRFNNPVEMEDRALQRAVQVSPRPRNLAVRSESWDGGRIVLSGGFEPSKTYEVAIGAIADRYGNRLAAPVRFRVETLPLPASATMPEGLILLDGATAKRFPITTRNVAEAEILAWPVPAGDAAAFDAALSRARSHQVPDGDPPVRIPVAIKARRDQTGVTEVDLTGKLAAGTSYVATLRAARLAGNAEPGRFPGGSEAERPSVALLGAASATSLAVHARELPGATLVHVARLASGEPVAGAGVRFGDGAAATTDADGVALLGVSHGDKLRVDAGGESAWVPLDEGGVTARQLFPELAGGRGESEDDGDLPAAPGDGARRAMVLTDRGIYRPGSTVWIKASVRELRGDALSPVANERVRLHVVGPTGEDVHTEEATTNDLGSAALKFDIPADEKLGRHRLVVEEAEEGGDELAAAIVQVAEFEPPRFAVDVDAGEKGAGIRAVVRGRYLFGAPMDGAAVSWTLTRRPAALPAGPLADAGLVFRRPSRWYDEGEERAWSRAGEARLAAGGTLAVEQAVPLEGARGPQQIELEADVTDGSHRHIAGRGSVVKHTARRYAGVKVGRSWVAVGEPVAVDLGVADTAGRSVIGADVIARMERVEWHYARKRAAGGATRWTWWPSRTEVGRCAVKSASGPARCALTPPRSGDYEITAEVDGQRGGAASLWAWREGDSDRAAMPERGRKVELATDKARYAPGEKAKIFVRSPYREATAILTVEQGGLIEKRAQRLTSGAAVMEVPLTAASAPYVHAAVTLLPIGERGEAAAEYRMGAVRLPVSLDASRLDVAIHSDRPTYEPGEEAEITIDVKGAGAPVEGAEVALAVVDEGILRLTNFHAPDPVAALHPGRPLWFHARDSREGLAELYERSHVAGDGGGAERATIDRARKDFVETALWRPDLRTDAGGRATVKFKLPDNLTQFRVMAVALDKEGKGASAESDFTVRKPLMLVPVVPRFAARGDHFEVAAMLHNNTSEAVQATVSFEAAGPGAQGMKTTSVTVSAGGHSRVGFPMTPDAPGDSVLKFAVADGSGKVRDRVESRLRVQEPGLSERPELSGAFAGTQEIALAVPASVDIGPGDSLRVQVGQHLWPELGSRLEYLLGYPHGCVEQTTSSTLPLIAAKDILPRIGLSKMSDRDLAVRIRAGLDRLASMRTESGGLAYWPGGDEPNVYGTAYAIRAVVLAKAAGVEAPHGLLDGMKRYLGAQLLSGGVEPEVKAAIAQSLAELGELPASAADALHDTRKDQSVFGKASLAIALSTLKGQDDRVAALLDDVEGSFDGGGKLTAPPRSNDFYYYGSPTRSRAQAAMALSRLRRSARVLPTLLRELATETDAYTTQATSYALLAVAAQLRASTSEGAAVRLELDGRVVEAARDLGFGSKEYRIPLSAVRGKKTTLKLSSEGGAGIAFQVSGSWRRPLSGAGGLVETSAADGPSVYRVYTDAKGAPIDLAKVQAGDVVRVALLVKLPADGDPERRGYLAVTDRLPAGFEPVQPDLATVASAPGLDERHPFASVLEYGGSEASHVELRDDRVNLYFDRIWGDTVAATYLARASTPGEFVLPPAAAELMYQGGSTGYSESGRVVIR